MDTRKIRENWPILVIALAACMLVLLAVLQFHWTGQISEAEEAMMESTLANSMRQFEQAVQRELTYLLTIFPQRVRGRPRPGPASYSQSYSLWSQTTSHPHLLRRVLLYRYAASGSSVLEEIPFGDGEVRRVEWEQELAGLRDRLDEIAGQAGQRLPSWTMFPESCAIVRGEFPSRRDPRLEVPGYLILLLDRDEITDSFLPELVDRMFAGPAGERLYEVAMVSSVGPQIVYRSDPSIQDGWLAVADSRRRFRVLMNPLPKGGPPPRPGEREPPPRPGEREPPPGQNQFRTGIPPNDRSFGSRPPGTARLLGDIGRPRIFVDGIESPVALEVAVRHVSGSLTGVVQRQRQRSLAVGLGVLGVLALAVAVVMVSSRKAQQLAEMQVQFIAGVTHELRTPLAVIRSAGENIADGVVTADERARKYGELVRDQGRRLSEMVEQTLQFAALDSGQRPFELEPIDISVVVADVLERARPMIVESGFTVDEDGCDEMPPARADKRAVQQILANLVSNAVKYGEPGRWLGVATRLDRSGPMPRVQVTVADRGMGIPPSEASRVFEPYFRGASASEASIQGSGLGLKLARDLTVRMGGNLYFESEVGKGSVFTLYLPVDSSAGV